MAGTITDTTPRVFGDYEVLDKIADGGMSSVHKARHRETGAVVTIKVLAPEFAANSVARDRLHQEFRATSLLRHPHLVRAIDGGQEAGTCYLVMEYVAGEDLWRRIERDGRLPEAEAVRIICQVTEALEAVHAHGIIHRDVKPSNILLTTDGQAKLADLGLAKDLRGDVNLTRPDQGLGTPNYIAPEQFAAAKDAGVLCDVYSVGATLYTAITGRLPFDAPGTVAVLKKKLKNDLVPPRQLVPGLSERVDWAIRRAVRANPEERHPSCLDFSNALTGRAEEQGPSSAAGRTRVQPSLPRGTERRVSVRYACAVPTQCNRSTSIHAEEAERQDSWEATVKDLSVGGIGILTSRRFEVGTVLMVDLRTPDQRPVQGLEVRVGRVKRVARGNWFHGCTFARRLAQEELRQLL